MTVTKLIPASVSFTAEECQFVCEALEQCERLKDAVRWERECRDTFAWLNNTLANVRADHEAHRSLIAARRAVAAELSP